MEPGKDENLSFVSQWRSATLAEWAFRRL